MAVDFDAALERAAAALARAATPEVAPLLVVGPPASGRSALLEAIVSTQTAGRCLRSTGRASIAHTKPFPLLRELLDPVLSERADLSGARRDALDSALASGPPAPGDRFGVAVAVLDLLDAVARRADGTVLVAVDDLHLADPASLECLVLLARLRGRVPVAVVATADHVIANWPTDAVASMRPPRGDADRDDPTAHLRTSIGRCSEAARTLLLLCASAIDATVPTITAAAAAAEVDLLATAEEVRQADLLVVTDGAWRFTHARAQDVVLRMASDAELRRGHDVLSRCEPSPASAWHHAACSPVADEAVACALQDTAIQLQACRDYAEASCWFERAAWMTVPGDAAAGRLMLAGIAAAGSGAATRAIQLLDQAARSAQSSFVTASALHLAGFVEVWNGETRRGMQRLLIAAAQARDDVPGLACHILGDAALTATALGDCTGALALAERADALRAWAGPSGVAVAGVALAWAQLLTGDGRAAGATWERVRPACEALAPTDPANASILLGRNIGLYGDDFVDAAEEAATALAAHEASGDLASRPFAVAVWCEAQYRLGTWQELDERYREAELLAELLAQAAPLAFLLVGRARLAAARGEPDVARQLASRATGIADEIGLGSIEGYAQAALGLAELGAGRTTTAIEHFVRLERLVHRQGLAHPTLVPWIPDAVAAHHAVGDRAEARRLTEVLADQVRRSPGDVGGALLARCRGIVADDDADPTADNGSEHFVAALDAHQRHQVPFDVARTQLAYGEHLRRRRQRRAARAQLAPAVEAFAELGAAGWHARAEHELAATDGARRPSTDELTAQQWRIAQAVASGARNAEIAAELYISTKTVEHHLSRIYRAHDLRSRAELTAWVLERGAPHN